MGEKLNPLISFYMTVKNGQSLVSDAIKSVLDQTYNNLELVVVDDGSSDDTVQIVRSFVDKDSRVKLIESGGVGRARALNIAVNCAAGEYLFNLDADDYAHPMRAEVQVRFMQEKNQRFVSSRGVSVFDSEKPNWKEFGSDVFNFKFKMVNGSIAYHNSINHSSVGFSRGLVGLYENFYDESRLSQIDYELWIRLAISGVKLNVLDSHLSAKRIHSMQSFENKKRIRYLWSSFLLNCTAISKLGGNPFYYFVAFSKFCYGVLPQKTRLTIKRMIN